MYSYVSNKFFLTTGSTFHHHVGSLKNLHAVDVNEFVIFKLTKFALEAKCRTIGTHVPAKCMALPN